MAFNKVLRVLLVACVFSVSAVLADWSDDVPEDGGYDAQERALVMELRSLRARSARAFECKNLGEECRGVVKCCGSTQCYWKDGYSIRTSGQCVECVQRNQLCQRDSQCCTSLVCQKANAYYVDGSCDNPRPSGQECHEDDQCQSKNCLISNWNKIKGQGGRCA